MSDLISRDKLVRQMSERWRTLVAQNGEYDHYTAGFDDAITYVDDAPAVDAVPVVHGRWVRKDEKAVMFDIEWECSKCGCSISTSGIYTPLAAGWNFCPNCGAKMDGGAEE